MKMKMLPANETTSVCFIPDVEFEDSGRWVDNMMNAEKSITEDEEEVNLYVTLNSDDAADTFIVLNMLDILLSMPESKVQLKKIFTVRSLQKCMAGIIRDDTEGFGVTELFHAIRAFLKYGKAVSKLDLALEEEGYDAALETAKKDNSAFVQLRAAVNRVKEL